MQLSGAQPSDTVLEHAARPAGATSGASATSAAGAQPRLWTRDLVLIILVNLSPST